mmetsp:Transcript_74498/g.241006  ORF Transcript_74498/g.241006 Transcript_74498/m.241006 type:complete len:894 (-) Transcript_74498:78-2759(-)
MAAAGGTLSKEDFYPELSSLAAEVAAEAEDILRAQPQLAHSRPPRCEVSSLLGGTAPALASWVQNVTAWFIAPWSDRQDLVPRLRSFAELFCVRNRGRSFGSCSLLPDDRLYDGHSASREARQVAARRCPMLRLLSILVSVDFGLQEPLSARSFHNSMLGFARYHFLSRRLRWPPPPTLDSASDVDAGIRSLRLGELRAVAQFRTLAVYNTRHPAEFTDNSCEGQWCFLYPCMSGCPQELCVDTRIDVVERGLVEVGHILDAFFKDPEHSLQFIPIGNEQAVRIHVEGRQFGAVLGPVTGSMDPRVCYECLATPERDFANAVNVQFHVTSQHGCVSLRIALELICAANDALQGHVWDAIARLFSAAMMTTICSDCVDGWWLPLRPAGLWHSLAAAMDGVAAVLDIGRSPVAWWWAAIGEARSPGPQLWYGPEVTVCPVELDDGVRLSCRGLEIGHRSRFANAVAKPERDALRSCWSSLQYDVAAVRVEDSGCDASRTLIMLPHSDLIGHVINGVLWFLPLVWSIHAEFGGPHRVTLVVIDTGWVTSGKWTQAFEHDVLHFDEINFESRTNQRFFMPLLPLLTDEPLLHMSEIVARPGCPSLCFHRGVWGFRLLSKAQERQEWPRRASVSVFQEAMDFWTESSAVVRNAMSISRFVVGPHVRMLSSAPDTSSGAKRALRIVLRQRVNTRRIENIEDLVHLLMSAPVANGLRPFVAVVGEGRFVSLDSMSPLEQMALARQADIFISPHGNELGFVAFMRPETWAVEMVPSLAAGYATLMRWHYCVDGWDANPGSLVGHIALRAGVHHACLNAGFAGANTSGGAALHWRLAPALVVDLADLSSILARPFRALGEQVPPRPAQAVPSQVLGQRCPWLDPEGFCEGVPTEAESLNALG